jgi:hypothetical protein
MLGAIIQNLVATATWRLEIVHPCTIGYIRLELKLLLYA